MRSMAAAQTYFYNFASGNESDDPSPEIPRFDQDTAGREDLPYKVELWDEAKRGVERVLAVTVSGSIGYAAYYAATREYPQRYVSLRHKNRIVSRSNPPEH
jgi:hypothetical protein